MFIILSKLKIYFDLSSANKKYIYVTVYTKLI